MGTQDNRAAKKARLNDMKNISEVIEDLKTIKDESGDLPVWLSVDYFECDDTLTKEGPVRYDPFVSKQHGKNIVLIWADDE